MDRVFLMWSLLHFVTSLEDTDYWLREGQSRLKDTLQQRNNEGRARNVILFIGDGMGINTVTAARIMQGQRQGGDGEDYQLSFERFPHVGLSKTYNVDKQVPDSAGTATAMLTGVKTKYGTIGLAPAAPAKEWQCHTAEGSSTKRHHIEGVGSWAQRAGKATGFVTTTRVTHATPASLYAHTVDRYWECDSKIPESQRHCAKDIARQLVEDEPGKDFNVILGGGQNQMGVLHSGNDPDTCFRTDGRNLVKNWLQGKRRAQFVNTSSSLMSADLENIDHLLGLFSPDHMPYIAERTSAHPSLVNMTLQAIKLLNRNKNGYFLLVEAGRIDLAHHKNMARAALREACELDEAVAAAISNTDSAETLIIVTADHSHSFTMNGYPVRGNDILGFANKPDETVYETLTYANGPGFFDHRANDSHTINATWKSLTDMDRSGWNYRSLATMYLKSGDETHGGEDVAVFSNGPWAHLLTGVFEQNYIGHVVSYATCIGPSARLCIRDRYQQSALEGNYKTHPRFSANSSAHTHYHRHLGLFVCITIFNLFS